MHRTRTTSRLYLERIYTNVLFDIWAGWLTLGSGFVWGEKLAVATAVLTVFWGSWQLMRRMTHAAPWPVTPLLAMLAYGWVFHMGFLNFYWSLGFCFWALAFAEAGKRWWWVALIPASVAHLLPVCWAIGLWAFRQGVRRYALNPGQALAGAAGAIAMGSIFIRWRYASQWSPEQALAMLGVDQLWLFGMHDFAIVVGFLMIWALGFLYVLHAQSPARLVRQRVVQFTVLTGIGVLLIPWVIHVPGFSAPLSFITQRMSLASGVLLCGLVLLGNRPRVIAYLSFPLAACYFGLLYRDTAELNGIEAELAKAVRTVPAGSRVVASFPPREGRVYAIGHMVDRACIGHCFSYANYEAATTQFRVRARGPNPFVAHDNATSVALQTAQHVVSRDEAPLYHFRWFPGERRFTLSVLRESKPM